MQENLGLHDVINFGTKHRDAVVRDVIEQDWQWVEWALAENIISLDDKAYKFYIEEGDF